MYELPHELWSNLRFKILGAALIRGRCLLEKSAYSDPSVNGPTPIRGNKLT